MQNFAGGGNGPTINYVASGGGFNDVVNSADLQDGILLAGSSTLSSTFNVQTTLAGSTTKITGGSGPNYFVVSSAANVAGVPAVGLAPNGTLNGIAGNLTIDAGSSAFNRLIVSDFGQTTTAKANVIQTAAVIGGVTYQQVQNFAGNGNGPTINYVASGGGFNDVVGGANLRDGALLAGSNTLSSTFNVQTTLASSTTKITGGSGTNYFIVSSTAAVTGIPVTGLTPNGTLNGIAGNLTIDAGSSAANRLIVSDIAQTITAKANVIQTAVVIGGVTYQQVQNFAGNGNGPTINYVASGGGFNDVVGGANLRDGILLAGSNTLSSTFNVQTTLANSTTKITGGSGTNYFIVSSTANVTGIPAAGLTPNGTLNGIAGNLTINAGSSASNRLIVSDYGQTTTAKTNVIQTAVVIGGVTYQQVQNFAGNGSGPTINYVASGGGFNDIFGPPDPGDGVLLYGSDTLGATFTFRTTAPGSALTVVGGQANDNFYVGAPPATAALTGNPANNGNLDLIQGQITVVGNGGSDALVVNDAGNAHTANGAHAFNYLVTPTQVVNNPAPVPTVPTAITPPARTFAGVVYNGSVSSTQDSVTTLRVDGTDDVNIFTVTPSTRTTYTINGNLPAPGAPIAGGGDYLELDTTHFADQVGGRTLHITAPGNGFWSFASATLAQPDYFQSIERFNHVAVTASVETLPNQPAVITVRDAETGQIKYQVEPYPKVTGTVSVAVADMNSDGLPDLIVAPGANQPAVITIYSGAPDANGNYSHPALVSFPAFAFSFRSPISLAAGDVNGDGANDLVVGAGVGGENEPTVEVFDGRTILTGTPTAAPPQLPGSPFLAFEPTFTGGVNVAVGDLNNDGKAEIVTTRQTGAATVNVFTYNGAAFTKATSFTAFTTAPNGGLSVAVGDFNGDGWNVIVLGSGAGAKRRRR